jgi:diguanylate cyclase (GGDEF)-like protein
MARIIGFLYLAGGVMVGMSLLLPHPTSAQELGLEVIVAGVFLIGAGMIRFSRSFSVAAVHLSIALGSATISLAIYLAGGGAAGFGSMFIWVVLVSAYFFPGRRATAHLAWLLACFGATLAVLPPGEAFSPFGRWLMTAFALGIASSLTSWLASGVRREIGTREHLEAELRHLAEHDSLTGLANRRRLEAELERELARAKRSGTTVCLALLDLDGFKDFNDRNGHMAGDELLRGLAGAWRISLRASDLLGRFGGDEFIAMLPECGLPEGVEVVERLRQLAWGEVTCSAGLAVSVAGDDVASLLGRADQALYDAKGKGRDVLALAA